MDYRTNDKICIFQESGNSAIAEIKQSMLENNTETVDISLSQNLCRQLISTQSNGMCNFHFVYSNHTYMTIKKVVEFKDQEILKNRRNVDVMVIWEIIPMYDRRNVDVMVIRDIIPMYDWFPREL